MRRVAPPLCSLFAALVFSSWPGISASSLPIDPSSPYAARRASRHAGPPAFPAVGGGRNGWNRSPRAPATWRFLHQDSRVQPLPGSKSFQVKIEATLRANLPGVTKLVLVTGPTASVQARLGDGAALPAVVLATPTLANVTVQLPAPLTPAADVALSLELEIKPNCEVPGQGSQHPCSFANGYQALVDFGAFAWNADSPGARFSSTLTAVVAKPLVVAAAGVPSPPKELPDGLRAYTFTQPDPAIPWGFSAAQYTVHAPPQPSEANLHGQLRAFIRDDQPASVGPSHLTLAQQVLSFLTKTDKLGPFPWQTLHLAQTYHQLHGARAVEGGVFFFNGLYGAGSEHPAWPTVAGIVSHEMGHQWFGTRVRPKTFKDAAISEGIAEFLALHFLERGPLQDDRQRIENNQAYVFNLAAKHDVALDAVTYLDPGYATLVYDKASIVLDMLRRQLGDAAFFTAVRTFYAACKDGDATVAQLVHSFGADLLTRDVAEQWLTRPGFPRWTIAATRAPDGTVSWRVTPTGEPFYARIDVAAWAWPKVPAVQVEVFEEDATSFTVPNSANLPILRPDPERHLLRHIVADPPTDVSLDGSVDGWDLVELALHDGASLRSADGKHFRPDRRYEERFDLNEDQRIDAADLEHFQNALAAPWLAVVVAKPGR